jgi:hypothetical protein
MKTHKFLLVLAAALGLWLIAGCSTPETRIRDNPTAFNQLTPAQQDMIRKGQVGLGFDETMVHLALGDPDRIRTRVSSTGTTVVWIYTDWEDADYGMPLYRGYFHHYWGAPFYPYYMSYPGRYAHDQTRVTLQDGKVIAVEQENP